MSTSEVLVKPAAKSPARRKRATSNKETAVKQKTSSSSPAPSIIIDKRVVISRHDMPDAMQQEAVALAHESLSRFKIEKDIACFIKKGFDSKHGANWHCIVGENFGSYISHDAKCFILFYIDKIAFQLYKIG